MCQFIIDSAASFGLGKSISSPNPEAGQRSSRANLLLFSASNSESLKRIAGDVENYCNSHPNSLDNVAYTLAKRREPLKLKNYCVVKHPTAPFVVSPQMKSQGPQQAAFVFTGQGAQW